MNLPIERRIAAQAALTVLLSAAESIVLNVANEASLHDGAWESAADDAVDAIRAAKKLIADSPKGES